MYKCSKCGKEGHNRTTCTTPQIFFSSRSIIAGEYVVNDCPFEAFGVLNEYIDILSDRGKEIGREDCAIEGEKKDEDVALTILVNVGKEGDEVCNESMHEVVNEDGLIDEIDADEKALGESKCNVMMDLSEFEKEKVTFNNEPYVENEEVALTLLAKFST